MAPRFFIVTLVPSGSETPEEKKCYALEVALSEAKAALLRASCVTISNDSGQVIYIHEQLTELFSRQRFAYRCFAAAALLFAVTIAIKFLDLPAPYYRVSFALTMLAILANAVAWGSFVVHGNRSGGQG